MKFTLEHQNIGQSKASDISELILMSLHFASSDKCSYRTGIGLTGCFNVKKRIEKIKIGYHNDFHLFFASGEELGEGGSLNTSSLVRVVEIPVEKTNLTPTADVALPQGQLILTARDDTAEYDDQDTNSSFNDDPQYVYVIYY